jgi:hypothetical protein
MKVGIKMATRQRHDQLMHLYREHTHSGSNHGLSGSDQLMLEAQHQFVRDDHEDEKLASGQWGIRMARSYSSKLFKEYAIVDLQLYESNRVGMRWRIEKEVISGKGQFVCGSKHCDSATNLHSYEVPFRYVGATLRSPLSSVIAIADSVHPLLVLSQIC